jgi:hypothetical protein
MDGAVVHEPSLRVNLDKLLAAVQEQPQVLPVVQHEVIGDAYIRAGWIKGGTVVVGCVLSEAVPFVLLKGEAILAGEDGVRRIRAPFTAINPPGTRRALFAITDCYALNAIFAEGQTPKEVEHRIVGEQLCLDYQERQSQVLVLPSPG